MTKARVPQVRVVKARTAKQIAATARCAGAMGGITKSDVGLPSSSWWVGLSRKQMAARVAEEQNRMRCSKYGRLATPVLQD